MRVIIHKLANLNYFWALAERGLNPLFVLIATILAARVYGSAAVGSLAIVYLAIAAGQLLISRGTDQNLIAYIANSDTQGASYTEYRKRMRRLRNVALVAPLFLVIGIDDPIKINIAVGVAAGLMVGVNYPIELELLIRRQFKKIALVKASSYLASIALCFYLQGIVSDSYKYIGFIVLFEKIISTFLYIKFQDRPEKILNNNGLANSNIYAIFSILGVFLFNRFDQLYVFKVISPYDLGVYFSTLKFFDIVNLVISSIMNAHLKDLALINSSKDKVLIRKIIIIALVLVLIITISLPLLLQIVYKIDITDKAEYIYPLAIANMFSIVGLLKGPWVAKNGYYRYDTYCFVGGAIAAILYYIIIQPETLFLVAVLVMITQFIANILIPIFSSKQRDFLRKII